MKLARVVLDKAAPSYDREYDYLIPKGMALSAGQRAVVPFGKGNQKRLGFVLSVFEGEAPHGAKAVLSAVDREPLADEEGLFLIRTLRETTFCGWFDAVRALIPPGAGVKVTEGLLAVRGVDPAPLLLTSEAAALYRHLLTRRAIAPEEKALEAAGLPAGHPAAQELVEKGLATRNELVKKKIADERAVMVRLCVEELPKKLTKKQKAVAGLLSEVGCASVREIGYYCAVTRAVVDRMRKMGLVELFEELVVRDRAKTLPPTDRSEIVLTPRQQEVYGGLLALSRAGGYAASLLRGVTGSGKTLVFLKLLEETVRGGRTAIVMVPEIALTPQTVARFTARFGDRVAVIHSSLSMSERLGEWRRIREGKADVVVGTRSAVFAPLGNIGLIVIDEEQEHTYHSEASPRYHARDIAKIRAKRHGAQLLLCSATPSVESFYQAKAGKLHLFTLEERYSGGELPPVKVVDMREAPLAAYSTAISEELSEELSQNLREKQQSILLLNRRGYHTMLKCSKCGEAARCPNCSIPLTYHAANGRLMCHWCGYSGPEQKTCSACGSEMLRYAGVGTQKAEEELRALFPEARILRMDLDTTMSRFSHQKLFGAFAAGDYDIMIGTQMVAKGLDFPNVTLVGVLSADQSLYTEDFRGYEKTFSLITQVVGRCGRAEKPGRAVIQTFTPDNRVLPLAAKQDYEAFYREEIGYRRVGLYPPFCDIACATFLDESEKKARASAKLYADGFTKLAKKSYPNLPIRVLGPAECNVFRAAGRYRYRLLVKCRNNKATRELFWRANQWYDRENMAKIQIDFYYDGGV
ncbi:MAG TPA: primosomal protein N' [Candidatus Fimivivens faecavium]|nr:primosomal protein N' [Candidatus Fimivivens faecavium]